MNIQVKLDFASLSDPGRMRLINEDAISVSPIHKLAILADGMGGYNAGEIASGMACALLKNELEAQLTQPLIPIQDLLHQAIARTNNAIYQLAQNQPRYTGMGTTLILAVFHGKHLTVAHLGDSRLYRLRDKQMTQMTSDHSILQAQIDAGILSKEQAKSSQYKNLVTRALGIEAEVQSEIHTHSTKPDDLYLLCSDGLSDMLEEQELQNLLENSSDPLHFCANQLVTAANHHGGRDNISVILVKVIKYDTINSNSISRFLKWLK